MENTLPQNSQSQFETQLPVTTSNNSNTLKLALVGLLVLLPVVGVSGYYFGQEQVVSNKPNDLSLDSNAVKSTPLPVTSEPLLPLTSSLPEANITVSQTTKNVGWRVYKDYKRNIEFEYPPHLLAIADIEKTILVNPSTLGLGNAYPTTVLEISNEFMPLTYGSIDEPEEVVTQELAPVTILGAAYPFSRYILGEGGPCGGGSLNTYSIKLSDFNVFIYKNSSISTCDEAGNALDESLHKKVETKQSDLEYARQILETIKPL